ncbi:hypothetical protein Hanom_Chr12g01110731 [Helianthus anomalus]
MCLRKKRKLMGQPVGPAPSESDLEIAFVGSAKATGLRSQRSTSRGSKHSALDISSIPGPESPPVVVYGDSPARDPIHPEDVKRKGLEEVVRSGVAEKVLPSTLPWVIFREEWRVLK